MHRAEMKHIDFDMLVVLYTEKNCFLQKEILDHFRKHSTSIELYQSEIILGSDALYKPYFNNEHLEGSPGDTMFL